MDPAFVIPVIFVGIPWVLGWIFKVNLSHQRHMKALQLRAEMNSRLLDRIGTDPAVLELLKSDAQSKAFDVQLSEPASTPYMRALTAVQASFLLLAAGAACAWFSGRGIPGDGQRVFMFVGALGIALGIGSLLSAAAAFFAARLWRTLNTPA
jgi:hypothetical protein